jgi:ABC-type nitrate/sulfonate/bicarbonate transport system permease component
MRFPKFNVLGAAVIVAVGIAWEIVVRSQIINFEFLPAPSTVLVSGVDLLRSGEMLTQTLHTLRSVLIGWAVANVIGISLGLLLGFSAGVRRYVLASLEMLRPMPVVAFLPLALLLFNFSLTTELVLIIYAAVWPVLINTMGGIMATPVRLYDVGRTLRLSRARILWKVVLPAAAPAIMVGSRLSMGLALIIATIAEMLANPHGLGYAVISQLNAMQPQRMFAYVICIGIVAIALNGALIWLSRRMLRGHALARHA